MNAKEVEFFKVEVEILNSLGLHGRPSAKISAYCNRFEKNEFSFEILGENYREGDSINPKSLLSILAGAVSFGERLLISVNGLKRKDIAYGLKKIIETDFFGLDCESQLLRWITAYGEKDPIRLANLLKQGDPQKGEPNDLYHWYRTLKITSAKANEVISDGLCFHLIFNHFIIDANDSYGNPKPLPNTFELAVDITEIHTTENVKIYNQLKKRSPKETIFIKDGGKYHLRFGQKDIDIFRQSIIEILKEYK